MRSSRRTLPATLFLLLLVPLAAAQESRPTDPHAEWDDVLTRHVRGGRVDYLLVRRDEAGRLDRYLEHLARVDHRALPRSERMALYINAYNATMVREVARRIKAAYSVASDDFALFDEKVVRLKEGRLSLNELEHRIVRPIGDPRIHAALVCAARSCPPLIPRAYRAADLDRVLDANVRRWLNDPALNRVDATGKRLFLSRIFEWYAVDFGGKDGIGSWVDRYLKGDVAGFEVGFLDYDWRLNVAAPASGEWVVDKKTKEIFQVVACKGETLQLVQIAGTTPRSAPRGAFVPFAIGE